MSIKIPLKVRLMCSFHFNGLKLEQWVKFQKLGSGTESGLSQEKSFNKMNSIKTSDMEVTLRYKQFVHNLHDIQHTKPSASPYLVRMQAICNAFAIQLQRMYNAFTHSFCGGKLHTAQLQMRRCTELWLLAPTVANVVGVNFY